ncbi:MAG TPA: hypothetical protein VLA56_09225 [Pseudomonadales bacterium]|nr:hypothetical protein [Pseudomonadales bacterium]
MSRQAPPIDGVFLAVLLLGLVGTGLFVLGVGVLLGAMAPPVPWLDSGLALGLCVGVGLMLMVFEVRFVLAWAKAQRRRNAGDGD